MTAAAPTDMMAHLAINLNNTEEAILQCISLRLLLWQVCITFSVTLQFLRNQSVNAPKVYFDIDKEIKHAII